MDLTRKLTHMTHSHVCSIKKLYEYCHIGGGEGGGGDTDNYADKYCSLTERVKPAKELFDRDLHIHAFACTHEHLMRQ